MTTGSRKDFLYIRKKLKKLERLSLKYDYWPNPDMNVDRWVIFLDALRFEGEERKISVHVYHAEWRARIRVNPTYHVLPFNDFDERDVRDSNYHAANHSIPKDVKSTVMSLIRAHIDELCSQYEVAIYNKVHEKYAGVDFGNGAKQFPKRSSDFNIVWRKAECSYSD